MATQQKILLHESDTVGDFAVWVRCDSVSQFQTDAARKKQERKENGKKVMVASLLVSLSSFLEIL